MNALILVLDGRATVEAAGCGELRADSKVRLLLRKLVTHAAMLTHYFSKWTPVPEMRHSRLKSIKTSSALMQARNTLLGFVHLLSEKLIKFIIPHGNLWRIVICLVDKDLRIKYIFYKRNGWHGLELANAFGTFLAVKIAVEASPLLDTGLAEHGIVTFVALPCLMNHSKANRALELLKELGVVFYLQTIVELLQNP